MKRFSLTLKGSPPGVLFHRMSTEALLKLRDKTGKKSKSAAPLSLEEEAEQCIHRDASGRAVIPTKMLMAALMNAGVFIRLDQKRQLSTKDSSLLPGLLHIDDTEFLLLKPGSGDESTWGYASWRYTVEQGRNPNGGEAVCIVRPLFELWAITFDVTLDTDELAEDTFRRLFDLAGSRVGIGDWRPARKGVYGQFRVTRWMAAEDSRPKKKAA